MRKSEDNLKLSTNLLGINTHIVYLVLILLLISCTTNKPDFNSDITITDWQCKSINRLDTNTFIGSKNLYKMQIPNGFWTEEDLLDSLNGFSSIDSTLDANNTSGLSLVVLDITNKSFLDYVKSEYNIFKNRENISLLSFGKSEQFKDSSYWFLFKTQESHSNVDFNYIIYLNQKESDSCYLMQAIVYGEKNWEKRLCNLKEYLFTFDYQ